MKRTRGTRIALLLAVVQLVAAGGTLTHRWITTSTEVSVDRAVERFREMREAGPAPATTADAAAPAPRPAAMQAPPARGGGEQAAESTPAAETPAPVEVGFPILPPAAGVYEWDTDGYEEAAGIRRELPERSVRLITQEGANSWVNRHEYSNQHVDWFTLTIDERGVFNSSFRSKISFGPFGQDHTMTFEPPMRFSMFPPAVGQRWEGSFQGSSSGTYAGRTFERSTLDVGGEQVDVWGIEVVMNLERGEVTGTVVSRIWVSERYRLTVKESYDQNVKSGPGSYVGRWTITLRSTTPRT